MTVPPQLLIVDAGALRARLARHFRSAGYEILAESRGTQALAIARERRPEVVFYDLRAAEQDALEFCRRAKTDPALHTPLVTLFGEGASLADRIRGLEAGADDFITEPVDPRELIARVHAALRRRSLQLEQARAEHRTRLLDLAVMVNHEIGDPLTALFGHIELMHHYLKAEDSKRLADHLRQSKTLVERLAEVVHRLPAVQQRMIEGSPAETAALTEP
ncbi:MAG TPA: response regulator [Candidatus Polarisedimenticolaceae bacterium]|nr:response regulator [Candidatus Polarisedimenticolaceae bacterium]